MTTEQIELNNWHSSQIFLVERNYRLQSIHHYIAFEHQVIHRHEQILFTQESSLQTSISFLNSFYLVKQS